VKRYLNQFVQFTNSTDFEKLQQIAVCIQSGTEVQHRNWLHIHDITVHPACSITQCNGACSNKKHTHTFW